MRPEPSFLGLDAHVDVGDVGLRFGRPNARNDDCSLAGGNRGVRGSHGRQLRCCRRWSQEDHERGPMMRKKRTMPPAMLSNSLFAIFASLCWASDYRHDAR